MTVEKLIEEYGYWGEYPKCNLDEWMADVDNGDTRQGYWEWVVTCLEQEEPEN